MHYIYKQKFSVQKKVVTGATTLLAIYINLGQFSVYKNLIHPRIQLAKSISPYPRLILAISSRVYKNSRLNLARILDNYSSHLNVFFIFHQGLETTTFWHAASNKLFFFFVTMFQAVQKKKENKKIINQKSKRKTIIRKQ